MICFVPKYSHTYSLKVLFWCKTVSFSMKSYFSIISFTETDRKCITSRKIAGGETNVFSMPMWCGWYVGKKAIIFWHQHGFQQEYTWECSIYVEALVAQGIFNVEEIFQRNFRSKLKVLNFSNFTLWNLIFFRVSTLT